MTRSLKFHQAILEATDQCMAKDSSVYVMGLGVPDPKGIFGTTLGLEKKYGSQRVLDMPTSENGMTGVAIGSAILGMRPILTHQRVDFMLLSLDQIINNAAKWHYMFGGKMKVPLVIRIVIGRGWGQGPQHSQCLQSLFGHIPGLKVVMPSTPYDAKGLLISAIEDDNPVIFLEHRWLHGIFGPVPEEMYRLPIGKAKVIQEGKDISIVSSSHMTLESLKAAEVLKKAGIHAEIVDVRSVSPLDKDTIANSVKKTGRLLAVDDDWKTFGFGAEVLAFISENFFSSLKHAPQRISLPDGPAPTSWILSNHYYPRAKDIVKSVREMLGVSKALEDELQIDFQKPQDVPDPHFTGPF